MLEFAESHSWDTLTAQQVVDSAKNIATSTQRFVTDTINRTPSAHDAAEIVKRSAEKRTEDAKAAVVKVLNKSKSRAEAEVKKEAETAPKHAIVVKTPQFSEDITELVQKAEHALAGHLFVPDPATKPIPVSSEANTEITLVQEPASIRDEEKHVYEAPLPVGFEPPPGFSRPSPPKKLAQELANPDRNTPVALPLVAPAVSSLSTSEPIISHLAGTIDNLASYIASNPSATSKVTHVLETAKGDLTELAARIEKVKEEERAVLEAKLDEQTAAYSLKLMELEMAAQDKLDNQEEDFRKLFNEERARFVQAYRAKLEQELETQTELINERYVNKCTTLHFLCSCVVA
jgi:MICOS complex subunit MIC60